MKLLVEDYMSETNTSSEGKDYYISGVFATIGERNKNGRLYPMDIWKPQVEAFQKKIRENSSSCLGEWEHPYKVDIDPIKSCIKITELYIEGNKILGKAKVLNNNSDITNQIKTLIDEGIKLGISSRGVGNVDSNNTVTQFKLITFDLVATPSDFNANNLKGMKESFEKNYEVVDDMIVESSDAFNFEQNETSYYQEPSRSLKNAILDRINHL